MPLGQSLQGAPPQWWSNYIESLINRSRQLGSREYVPYGKLSREKNEFIKNEMGRLLEAQKGNEFDTIPFSITGSSKPIPISPHDLTNLIENEGFARRVYEKTTGIHNVSRRELNDLRKRAIEISSSLPGNRPLSAAEEPQISQPVSQREPLQAEVRKLVPENRPLSASAENRPLQQEIRRLEPQEESLESQNIRLKTEQSVIQDKRHVLRQEMAKLSEIKKTPEINEQIQRIVSQEKILEKQLYKISDIRTKVETKLRKFSSVNETPEPQRGNVASVASKLIQSQSNPLGSQESELQKRIKDLKNQEENLIKYAKITSQSDPGNMTNAELRFQEISSERRNLESQLGKVHELFHPVRQNPESQHVNISSAREIPEPQRRNISAAAERSIPQPQRGIRPLDLFERAAIEREMNELQAETALIAPMNQTSQRAKKMLESSFDDNMDLIGDELRESHRHNELDAVEPLVRSSIEGPSDEYMNKYIDDYTKDIRKALEDESEKEFLTKIAPKINMSFAQMGAFHSGARQKALNDTLGEHSEKLRREISHLTGTARDKAMEHHELQKRREQSAAHVLGHTIKSQKESSRHQAELARQHEVTKHGLAHLNAAALGQIGTAEQLQKQHEIDVKKQQHEREILYPHEQLARQFAEVSGLPPQPIQALSGNVAHPTTPPNLFTLGAGALATTFGQPQQKFKGGSVRKKYADGGHIGSDEIGNEIRKIIQAQNQGDKEHLEQASHHDPMQNWLRHVGREMLTNPHEDPLLSLGRGTSAAMDHRDVMRERASNLYDKIQATKLNQYKVLAEYENMKEKTALGRETLKETGRYHDIMSNLQGSRLNVAPKKTSTQQKLEDKALENIVENHEMKNDLNLMQDAIKKSTLGTGPWIGVGKSFLGIDNDIDVLGNHIVTKANKLYGRGAGSNLQLKTLQGGKPGQHISEKANKTIIKKYGQESDRRIKKNISYLLKAGWSPEEISSATGVQIPGNSSVENEEEKIPSSPHSNIVNMTDPSGNPLQVPEDQVDHAISLGAFIAQ